jgi:predicted ATPase/transcriptional regulator with XRE-family HTH domain
MEMVVSISPGSFTSFGELLRFLRERVELSQKELALQVGYHYSYMSRIEKNQRIPDAATLMARFVPALALDREPEWTARLLELAGSSAPKMSAPISARDSKPGTASPPTALPIFDLSSSNLPIILTPLLGRDEEVVALTNLLAREDVRLVTLIGPPGVGKTRLAAHIAAQMAGSFAHGPLFVDLTSIADVEAFLPTLVEALGVRETSEAPLLKSIVASLRPRNLLLVLDNFEQVINAASYIPPLLVGAPGVKIIATSREALHVSGEYEFPLVPLSLPESSSHLAQGMIEPEERLALFLQSSAVQLFVQRAQAVQPGFKLTGENAIPVVDICRHLDGLPLAIELAAARIKTLNPQAMLQQLNHRLDWLTRGSRDANRTRQTLRGAMEWSYALLSELERTLLRRLSVFSGGWTLRAAESVCTDTEDRATGSSLRREDILDLLIKLVDKSLVIADAGTQQTRYHLFETMREFGREKLLQESELSEVLNRHLKHFAEYAEESESHLDGFEQTKWIEISEKEHNNFRSAIDYSLTPGADVMDGFRIGAAISLFWIERNHFHEGIERLQSLLQRAVDAEHQPAKAKMLYRAAAMHSRLFSYNAACKLCEQSIEVSRTLADQRSLASALYYMGEIYIALHDHAQAKAALEESVSLCWNIPFPQQLNMALTSLGRIYDEQGGHERALTITKEALALAEQIDDTWGMIHALQLLGMINRYSAERDLAIDYFERSLPAIRLIGDRYAEGITLANLSILYNLKENYSASGHAAERSFALFQSIGDEVQQPFPLRMMGYSAIHARNLIRARTLILESLKGNREQGHPLGQLACLIALAACEMADENVTKAVTLAGCVENHMQAEAESLLEPDALALELLLVQGKEKLGKKTFEQTLKQGGALGMEDLVAQELPSAV